METERTLEQVVRDLDDARGMRDTAQYAREYAANLGMHAQAQAAHELVDAALDKEAELRAEYKALGGL